MAEQSAEKDALREAYIWRVYNDPQLHGSYCPCAGCESISGPLPEWIHTIGQRANPAEQTGEQT